MARKTTVTLPDDLHDTWKRSGLHLAEVIRRGLDGTGDTARHAAAETRLAQLEHRVAQLEAAGTAGHRVTMFGADDDQTPPDFDEWEAQHEEWERRQEERREQAARERRALLLNRVKHLPGEPCTVTIADAMAHFHRSRATAAQFMHEMTSYGLARQLDRKEGTGEPYRWVIEPDGDNG